MKKALLIVILIVFIIGCDKDQEDIDPLDTVINETEEEEEEEEISEIDIEYGLFEEGNFKVKYPKGKSQNTTSPRYLLSVNEDPCSVVVTYRNLDIKNSFYTTLKILEANDHEVFIINEDDDENYFIDYSVIVTDAVLNSKAQLVYCNDKTYTVGIGCFTTKHSKDAERKNITNTVLDSIECSE